MSREVMGVVDGGPTEKVWRAPEWGHPGGFRKESKDYFWEWGSNGDGTWFAREVPRHGRWKGNPEDFPTVDEAQWYAEYCDSNPGAHSNWALYQLHQWRLKQARSVGGLV